MAAVANVTEVDSTINKHLPTQMNNLCDENNVDFPETDAEAAEHFSADISPVSPETFASNISTSDIIPDPSRALSSSLPVISSSDDKIDPHTLKTLIHFVLDACRKLHVLYAELDTKMDKNINFINEKLSILHLLHQTTFAQSLKECRDERHELSTKIDALQMNTNPFNIQRHEADDDRSSDSFTSVSSEAMNHDSNDRADDEDGALHNMEAELSRMNEAITKLSTDMYDLDARVIECE